LLELTWGALSQIEEHAAAETRAVAAENARAAPVFISGATGDNAASVNGFFEPTQEKGLDGRVLYAKRGDASTCLEHYEGDWEVKPVDRKGKNGCTGRVEGNCALEDCTSRRWKVANDGQTFREAPSVKLVAGAEAERQVRGGCLRARQHALPPQLQPPPHSPSPPSPLPCPLFLVLCDAV
jgi:hypothetical protein